VQHATLSTLLLAGVGFLGMTYAAFMGHACLFCRAALLGRGVTFMNFAFIGGAGVVQWLWGLFVEAAARRRAAGRHFRAPVPDLRRSAARRNRRLCRRSTGAPRPAVHELDQVRRTAQAPPSARMRSHSSAAAARVG
jgi:hypothetical protein